MTILETERLVLRQWRPEDVASFAEINADARVMRYFPAPMTRMESEEAIKRMEQHFEKNGYGLYAAEARADSKLIGFVGLARTPYETPFTPCVEIGWRLAFEYWNQGLATEGARKVLEHAFLTLELPEVVSFTAVENLASRRVMEKIGLNRIPDGDFDHPKLPAGHPLRRHVFYRITRADWFEATSSTTNRG